jgi:hypothetical protein
MPPCAEMQIKDWDFHDEFSDQYILIENLLKKHHLTPVRPKEVHDISALDKSPLKIEIV